MSFMKWDEQYAVHIRLMDDQHKRLFDMIDQFYVALQQKETQRAMSELLTGLTEYSLYHFHAEERMMSLNHFPLYAAHKSAHEKFIMTVQEFKDRFDSGKLLIPIEVAQFLKQWLSNHILMTDKHLGKFLQQQNQKRS